MSRYLAAFMLSMLATIVAVGAQGCDCDCNDIETERLPEGAFEIVAPREFQPADGSPTSVTYDGTQLTVSYEAIPDGESTPVTFEFIYDVDSVDVVN